MSKKIIAHSIWLTMLVLLMSTSVTYASGTIFNGGSQSQNAIRPSAPVDARYERGKGLLKGAKAPYKGIKFCISTDNAEKPVQKIKRKLIKTYKSTSANILASKIVTCDDGKLLLEVMNKTDAINLLYYLNKRFKLKLA